jgi:hypothetical protein
MNAPVFFGLGEVPWQLVIPLTAGLAVTGVAFAMSRFVFAGARSKAAAKAKPDSKQKPEFDPFVQGSPTEQRNAFRRGGNPVEVLLARSGQQGQAVHAWVVDRSMGGLCIEAGEAFPPGTMVIVRALNAPTGTPWVDMEVKSCRPSKTEWELGCQFVKSPPWAVMLLFG